MAGPKAALVPPVQTGAGFGHGKVILLGEHAVVYGQPALAAGVPTGIRAGATPGEGKIGVPAWNLHAHLDDGSQVAQALNRLLACLQAPRMNFSVVAEIPSRAGLGSSAALAVAVARAACTAAGIDASADTILAAVNEAEGIFHATPSGIDGAAAFHGGVGCFSKEKGWQPITLRRPLKLCVGLTGKPRDTSAQVEAVGRLCARAAPARRLIQAIGEASLAGASALQEGDIDSLGRMFDIAHGLLAGLRVSSPEIETMVHAARAAGAIGAKLTGAGGGGAVIALAPSHNQDVLDRWRALGFDGFKTEISGEEGTRTSDD